MIDRVDLRLKEWIESVLEETEVSFRPPGESMPGSGIILYLMELASSPPPAGGRRPPLQIYLRYLVTAWSDEPEEAHRLLGELVFAAMENRDFEVELEPIPVGTWRAFGVVPRPSFVLRAPLRRERLEPTAPVVRAPVVVKSSPIVSLAGVVLGPDSKPIMDAQVEVEGLKLFTRTDNKGRFRFPAVPAEPPDCFLRITARGQDLVTRVKAKAEESGLLIIHLKGMEE